MQNFTRNGPGELTPREHRELRLKIEQQISQTLSYPEGATTAQKVSIFRDAVEKAIAETIKQRIFDADVEKKREELAAAAYAQRVEQAALA